MKKHLEHQENLLARIKLARARFCTRRLRSRPSQAWKNAKKWLFKLEMDGSEGYARAFMRAPIQCAPMNFPGVLDAFSFLDRHCIFKTRESNLLRSQCKNAKFRRGCGGLLHLEHSTLVPKQAVVPVCPPSRRSKQFRRVFPTVIIAHRRSPQIDP